MRGLLGAILGAGWFCLLFCLSRCRNYALWHLGKLRGQQSHLHGKPEDLALNQKEQLRRPIFLSRASD
jgi:hypothetical protein